MEAIATRLEAIAARLEAIATRVEAIATRVEAMCLGLCAPSINTVISGHVDMSSAVLTIWWAAVCLCQLSNAGKLWSECITAALTSSRSLLSGFM